LQIKLFNGFIRICDEFHELAYYTVNGDKVRFVC